MKQQPLTGQDTAITDSRESLQQNILQEIERFKSFSNRGLWALSLFLLVSMTAWGDFAFLVLPESVVKALGQPPSSQSISILLIIYTFSAIMLSLSRMMAGIEHKSSFCHVGYLTIFYLFYHFARSLGDNYWAVFGAGITILLVESYRIWTFCSEMIAKKKEELEYVRKTGRRPIEEIDE